MRHSLAKKRKTKSIDDYFQIVISFEKVVKLYNGSAKLRKTKSF